MITKGIIEGLDGYKALVRLPIFDGNEASKVSTKSNNLSKATYCSIANVEIPFAKGDIVFVGFEDNDTSKPIILGHLYKSTKQSATPGLNLSTLNTSSTTKLSESTYIGNVKPNELAYLTGLKANIQRQLDELKSLKSNSLSSSGSSNTNTNTGSTGSVDLTEVNDKIYNLEYQTSRLNNSVNSINTVLNNKANLNSTGGLQLKSGALEFDNDSNTFWTSSNLNIGGNINVVGTIYQNGKEIAEKDHIHSNYLTLVDTQTLIDNSISNLIAGAPTTFDTLKELADAVQQNKSLIDTIENSTSTMLIRRWR